MEPSYIAVIASIQACLAIFTMSVNILTTQRRLRKTSENDARRLRMLFAAELEVLRENFNANISVIYESANVVMSSRSIVWIYRANLGKLTVLHEREIPAVVAAYAFCENIDAFLAAHAKPNGQSSYSLGKERPYANELVALYNKGVELVDRALLAMRDLNDAPRARAAVAAMPSPAPGAGARDLASAPRMG